MRFDRKPVSNPSRRAVLAGGAAALSLPFIGRASAQGQWPNKFVRVIVPFAAGGTTDILGRLMAQKLSEEYGQQFIVENKAGAGGNIGADAAAKSDPDGYTFVIGTPGPHVINQYIYKNQPFDGVKDLAPVIVIARVPNLISINPDIKAKTLAEFIALAKANPGKLSYASPGNGSTGHVSTELLKSMAGIDLTHVPYRGSALAITDVIAGRVEMSLDNLPAVQPHVEAGKLRALAVTTAKRWPLMPDVPTVAEAGVPGYEASSWFTIAAPAKTPPEIIAKVNKSCNTYMADAAMIERMRKLGADPVGGSPDDMAKLMADENAKWKKAIEFAKIQPE
ncbi:tripartite tricarboxylate transporter substrate binding protein [Bradyrhizobium sp. LHD-71]|uniref:Bug family tripartite tricarboxylate transporter substrate binding protein n=1 Tax=Bradyrhizobium sp. LHD-71 TaxID=3072141 RepID=UPI00280D36E2|nr:tripartite tricarboxylate transporter substrate binding protein [Bradyrhizobium sp. LHD-71]MDQ8730943.1 tripartite tricarboxylate transporter substrate binding protein [Bradyrhizobium sp. LHD-71]